MILYFITKYKFINFDNINSKELFKTDALYIVYIMTLDDRCHFFFILFQNERHMFIINNTSILSIHMYIYIYIYIERERERAKRKLDQLNVMS